MHRKRPYRTDREIGLTTHWMTLPPQRDVNGYRVLSERWSQDGRTRWIFQWQEAFPRRAAS